MKYETRLAQARSSLLRQYRCSDEQLAVFRVVYALYWLYALGVPYLGWIAENPNFVFTPPPFLSLLITEVPHPLLLHGLSFATLGALCSLLLGWKIYWTSITTTFFLILTQALTFSFGKIDHTILAVLVPFFMRNSSWGHPYSIDGNSHQPEEQASQEQSANALFDLAIILGFAYWTAGVVKVYGGWLDLDQIAVRSYFATAAARGDIFANVWLLQHFPLAEYWLFWKSLDVMTVLFECGFLVVVWRKKWLEWYVPLALLFHLTIGFVLGITFWIHGLVFLVFFPRVSSVNHPNVERLLRPKILVVLVFPAVLWCFYFSTLSPAMPQALYSSPIQWLLTEWTDQPSHYLGMASNSVILVLWLFFLARSSKNMSINR